MIDEKMIKEMAKCMCSSYESGKGCNTCPTNWCYADECATNAFCNGYRKLPKNAIVLEKDEYETEQRAIKYWKKRAKMWRQAAHEIRKETAREIRNKFRELLSQYCEKMTRDFAFKILDETIKQCGVEVE